MRAPTLSAVIALTLAGCATARLPIIPRELTPPEVAELAQCRDGDVLRANASVRCGDLDTIERLHRQQLADIRAAQDAEGRYREELSQTLALGDAAARAGRRGEALRHYTEAIAIARPRGDDDLRAREKAVEVAAQMSELPPVPEEARRHAIRAEARVAMEGADFAAAADEMTQAVRLAPWWADAHYNLGLMAAAANQHVPAMNALKFYLQLSPGSAEADAVRAKIYQLELAAEDEAFTQALAGDWLSAQQEVFSVALDPDGKVRVRAGIYDFTFTKRGTALEGHASIASRRWDYCDIPGEQSTASGRISANGEVIELQTQVSRYATDKRWVGISMGMYECTSVVFLQKEDQTFTLGRSVPASRASE